MFFDTKRGESFGALLFGGTGGFFAREGGGTYEAYSLIRGLE